MMIIAQKRNTRDFLKINMGNEWYSVSTSLLMVYEEVKNVINMIKNIILTIQISLIEERTYGSERKREWEI